MNDFKDNESYSNSEDNGNLPYRKKPNFILDLLIGLGISLIVYAALSLNLSGWIPSITKLLIDFAILTAVAFLLVKLFRTDHTPAAVLMLILISPGVLALLLFGACGLMLSGFN